MPPDHGHHTFSVQAHTNRFGAAFSPLAVAFSVTYRFGANAGQRFRSVIAGVVLAVVLWTTSSAGFFF